MPACVQSRRQTVEFGFEVDILGLAEETFNAFQKTLLWKFAKTMHRMTSKHVDATQK